MIRKFAESRRQAARRGWTGNRSLGLVVGVLAASVFSILAALPAEAQGYHYGYGHRGDYGFHADSYQYSGHGHHGGRYSSDLYRSYRHPFAYPPGPFAVPSPVLGGVPFVRPDILLPLPYGPTLYGPTLYPPAGGYLPPRSGISIQTPFFSYRSGPRDYLSARPPVVDHLYQTPGYRSYAYPGSPAPSGSAVYSPGAGGGIPDVTSSLPGTSLPGTSLPGTSLPGTSLPGTSLQPADQPSSPISVFDASQLQHAADQLTRRFDRQGDTGEAWLEYLMPDKLPASLATNKPEIDANEWLRRYEGVTMNPELKSVWQRSDFQTTYQQFRAWSSQQGLTDETQTELPSDPELPESNSGDTRL